MQSLSAVLSDGATAVCLSGQLRVFLEPAVQDSLVAHLHHQGYEYFVSTDVVLSPHDGRLKVAPVVAVYTDSGSPLTTDGWRDGGNHHGQLTCPRGTAAHFYLFPQMVRFVSCHQMIVREETLRKAQYTYVMRTRTDLLFRLPFPAPPVALARQTHKAPDLVLFDDQLSVAAREHAATILLNPVLAYRECHDAEQCSLACGKSVQECTRVLAKGAFPCPPMNLIAAYAPTLPTIKQCGFLWASRCPDLNAHGRHGSCLAVLKSNDSRKHHTSC